MSKKRKFSASDLVILIIAGIIIIPTLYVAFNKVTYTIPEKIAKLNPNAHCKSDIFLKNLDESMIRPGRQYDEVIKDLRIN